jgi:hypothetical protein
LRALEIAASVMRSFDCSMRQFPALTALTPGTTGSRAASRKPEASRDDQ